VNSLPVLERHPSLRWLVPAVVVGVLVTVVVNAVRSGDEPDTSLPTVSVGSLIAQVRTDERPDFSGTAIVQLSESAAALSAFAAVSAPSTSLAGMQAGSHTLRLWYGGRTQERIALVGALAETDVFRSGNQLWQWSSAQRVAVHSTVPVKKSAAGIWLSAVTPVDLADQMLSAAQVDTSVSVAGAEQVAGRPAYGLVLKPRSPDTLVDYVHIAVDGATKTPLAVQIYSRDDSEAAIDVAFTDVRFANQNDSMFTFHPPAGASVQKAKAPAAGTTSYGSGWTAVLCFRSGRAAVLPQTALGASTAVTVKGQWGRGRLVQSPLLTALTTQDGHTYVGPVRPAALYAAAASQKR
jgi:outer membrane lipoprotein-sorting protein